MLTVESDGDSYRKQYQNYPIDLTLKKSLIKLELVKLFDLILRDRGNYDYKKRVLIYEERKVFYNLKESVYGHIPSLD